VTHDRNARCRIIRPGGTARTGAARRLQSL